MCLFRKKPRCLASTGVVDIPPGKHVEESITAVSGGMVLTSGCRRSCTYVPEAHLRYKLERVEPRVVEHSIAGLDGPLASAIGTGCCVSAASLHRSRAIPQQV